MYHEQTAAVRTRKRRRRIAAVIVVCVLAVALWFAYGAAMGNIREQGAASIRSSILDSAMQCCAIEGSYPATLNHLETEYGLRINHDDYIITYETFAENVMPSVVVVPR